MLVAFDKKRGLIPFFAVLTKTHGKSILLQASHAKPECIKIIQVFDCDISHFSKRAGVVISHLYLL